jgi:hypothetical protein
MSKTEIYMNRLCATSLICLAVAAGCGDDHAHPAAPAGATTKADGHDHGHDHHDEGPKEMLGLVEVEGFEVSAVQIGKIAPGAEVSFDVEILGKNKPAAVRFWLGQESALPDTKRPPEQVKDNVYHVDLTAPASPVAGSRLWVEIDRPGTAPVLASFEPKSSSK